MVYRCEKYDRQKNCVDAEQRRDQEITATAELFSTFGSASCHRDVGRPMVDTQTPTNTKKLFFLSHNGVDMTASPFDGHVACLLVHVVLLEFLWDIAVAVIILVNALLQFIRLILQEGGEKI